MAVSKIETFVTSQNISDVRKIIDKNDYTQEEQIKISIAFGSALSKQNFEEPTEYYQFVKEFEQFIEERLV